jgi:hypothetical protein
MQIGKGKDFFFTIHETKHERIYEPLKDDIINNLDVARIYYYNNVTGKMDYEYAYDYDLQKDI